MRSRIQFCVRTFVAAGGMAIAAGCVENKQTPGAQAACVNSQAETVAVATLDARTRDAIVTALADERHARAMYAAVIDKECAKRGEASADLRPFSMIVQAEERHVRAIESLMARYSIPDPGDSWKANPPKAPDSFVEACRAGVQIEEANIAMFDEFLTFTEDPTVRQVFTNLRSASADRHLPAFRRWAAT